MTPGAFFVGILALSAKLEGLNANADECYADACFAAGVDREAKPEKWSAVERAMVYEWFSFEVTIATGEWT